MPPVRSIALVVLLGALAGWVVLSASWSPAAGVDARSSDGSVDAATLSALVLEPANPAQNVERQRPPRPVARTSWFPRRGSPPTPRASVANRNNNPLNIKFGVVTRAHVESGLATISGITPLDGGRFLRFRSPVAGFRAGLDLLKSRPYAQLELDEVVRRWTNNGAGAFVLAQTPLSGRASVDELGTAELTHLLHAMARAEGYRSPAMSEEIARALRR